MLWTLRLTPSTVIWRSGVSYGFDRQKLITRRNLRWFYFWRLTVGFTVWNRQELVIYGGKPSEISNLRWETVSSWPGRARLDWLRATGPHEPSWPDYRRTFYIYIANRNCCLWGIRSLSWHSEPLSSWRRTVTYDSPPSVWISPLITVMWRRRHLSTVIYGAISDWRRKFTTLTYIRRPGQNRIYYVYAVHDRILGDFSAKYTVYTPYIIYIMWSGQP